MNPKSEIKKPYFNDDVRKKYDKENFKKLDNMILDLRLPLIISNFTLIILLNLLELFSVQKNYKLKDYELKCKISFIISIIFLVIDEVVRKRKLLYFFFEFKCVIFSCLIYFPFSIIVSLLNFYVVNYSDPIRFVISIETIMKYLVLIIYNHSFKINCLTSLVNIVYVFVSVVFFTEEMHTICYTITMLSNSLGIIIFAYYYEQVDFKNFCLLHNEIDYFHRLFEKMKGGTFVFTDGLLSFHNEFNKNFALNGYEKYNDVNDAYSFIIQILLKATKFNRENLTLVDIQEIKGILNSENTNVNNEKMILIIQQLHYYLGSIKKFTDLNLFGNVLLLNNNHEKLYYQIYISTKHRLEIVFIDVTKAVLIEKKENELRFTQLYLAKIAHEFKNPLLNILSLCESKDSTLNYNNKKFETVENQANSHIKKFEVDKIMNLCQLMLFLVEDLSYYSKIENYEINEDKEITDLVDLVDGSINIVKTRHSNDLVKRNVEIKKTYEIENVYINTYSLRLKQILINLLMNSFKFTFSGVIEVKIEKIEKNHEFYLRVIIEDTGIGMEVNNLSPKINDEDSPRRYTKNGSGFGLLIVKDLLKTFFQSELKIFSNISKGTMMWFDFPFKEHRHIRNSYLNSDNPTIIVKNIDFKLQSIGDDIRRRLSMDYIPNVHLNDLDSDSSIDLIESSDFSVNDKQNLRILICDDDEFMLNSVKSIIRSSKYKVEVFTANDGLEVLNILINEYRNGNLFDLLIIDETMPIMKGSTCIKNIKIMVAENIIGSFPLCSLTAYCDDETINSIKISGADLVISKPFSQAKFKQCIDLIC